MVARGELLYHTWCPGCHGSGVTSGSSLPDLKYLSANAHARWDTLGSDRARGRLRIRRHAGLRPPVERSGFRGSASVCSEPDPGRGKRFVWIGSANFTGGGFGGNRELLLETDAVGVAKEAEAWFDDVWNDLSCPDVEAVLERYAKRRRKQGVVKQLGQLVEPSQMSALGPTRFRFQHAEGRGASNYTGEVTISAGRSHHVVPYTSATKALCAVLEALHQGHRGFLAKCARDAAFVQPHRNDTTSQYLAPDKRCIKEVGAHQGDLGAKAKERILKTLITPVRLEGGWWVSRDTNPKRVWTMIRAAARIAGAETVPKGSDPGF